MYLWDLHEKYIDPKALDTDLIIHLAGEGIADKRWTPERKDVLQASRIQSAQLLYNAISKRQKNPYELFPHQPLVIMAVIRKRQYVRKPHYQEMTL